MISVKKQIVVETSQQRAFRVFTEGMDRWWPRAHHVGKSPLDRIVVEPRPGGRWYAICQDASECDIGKVIAWEPPGRLVLAWQITAQWQYDPALLTEIDVQFIVESPRRTRVELEHKHLEHYGDAAEKMRETFELPDAWQSTLDGFARASVAPKFLMIYEATPEGLTRAPLHMAGHRARLDAFHARGGLMMAGPVLDGSGRAFGVFHSREAADEFMRDDPFVVHGVVARTAVLTWDEVLD